MIDTGEEICDSTEHFPALNGKPGFNNLKKISILLFLFTTAVAAINWYARKKMPLAYAAEMSYSELYEQVKEKDRSVWAFAYDNNYSPSEKEKIKKLLSDSMHLLASDPSYVKIEKIIAWLYPFVPANYDEPGDSVYSIPVSKLIECMQASSIKVFCTNHTEILGLLATEAGMQVRSVTNEGAIGPPTGLHSFNEVFIPEAQRWAYTDLTHGIAYIKKNDIPLNIVDVNQLLNSKVYDSNITLKIYDKGLQKKNFDAIPNTAVGYFSGARQFRYYHAAYLQNQQPASFMNRAKIFFSSHPQYSFYGKPAQSPAPAFLLRLISSYILLVCVAGCINLMIYRLFLKRGK